MAKKKASKKKKRVPICPMYGVCIHEAVASGNLAEMRKQVKAAEKYLKQYGNVAAALEALKIEIAKLEAGG